MTMISLRGENYKVEGETIETVFLVEVFGRRFASRLENGILRDVVEVYLALRLQVALELDERLIIDLFLLLRGIFIDYEVRLRCVRK